MFHVKPKWIYLFKCKTFSVGEVYNNLKLSELLLQIRGYWMQLWNSPAAFQIHWDPTSVIPWFSQYSLLLLGSSVIIPVVDYQKDFVYWCGSLNWFLLGTLIKAFLALHLIFCQVNLLIHLFGGPLHVRCLSGFVERKRNWDIFGVLRISVFNTIKGANGWEFLLLFLVMEYFTPEAVESDIWIHVAIYHLNHIALLWSSNVT